MNKTMNTQSKTSPAEEAAIVRCGRYVFVMFACPDPEEAERLRTAIDHDLTAGLVVFGEIAIPAGNHRKEG